MPHDLVHVQVICIYFLKIACDGISTGHLGTLVLILIPGSLIAFSGQVKGNNSDGNYLTETTLSQSYIQKFSAKLDQNCRSCSKAMFNDTVKPV